MSLIKIWLCFIHACGQWARKTLMLRSWESTIKKPENVSVCAGWETFIEINGLIISPWRKGRWRRWWMGDGGQRLLWRSQWSHFWFAEHSLWICVKLHNSLTGTCIHSVSLCLGEYLWLLLPVLMRIFYENTLHSFFSPLMPLPHHHLFNWQVPDTLWPDYVQWVIHEGPTWFGFQ